MTKNFSNYINLDHKKVDSVQIYFDKNGLMTLTFVLGFILTMI